MISLLITLLNNFLCYHINDNVISSLEFFFKFLDELDLQFIVGNNKETVNLVLTLGNAIVFNDKFLLGLLKQKKYQDLAG